MKAIKIVVIATMIALTGCANRNTDFSNSDGKLTKSLTDKGFLIDKMTENVNQCIELAKTKYESDQSNRDNLNTYTNESADSTERVAVEAIHALKEVALAIEHGRTKIEMARLGVPFSTEGMPACEKLGYSHMVIEKKKINHATLNNLGGKVLKAGLAVFGIYQGTKVALKVIDELAEPKIKAGDGSTNILGNDNNYQPDNSVNNAGGTCPGEVVGDTCVTPIEEQPEPEPEPTEPEPQPDPVEPDPIDETPVE